MPRPASQKSASQRQLRVGEMIRRTLSAMLAQGDLHDPEIEAMSITVGEVRLPPDLSVATAYVLPLGGRGAEAALAALRRNKGEIRRLLGREVILRHVPDLRFEVDATYDRIDATRRLFADARVQRDVAAPEDVPGLEGREP